MRDALYIVVACALVCAAVVGLAALDGKLRHTNPDYCDVACVRRHFM